jgi:hypothetical protein
MVAGILFSWLALSPPVSSMRLGVQTNRVVLAATITIGALAGFALYEQGMRERRR